MSGDNLCTNDGSACVVAFRNQTVRLERSPEYDWSLLVVFVLILAGGIGNIFVFLAVAMEKKLQKATNYFFLSLAAADLLVSFFVMPLGAVPAILGEFRNYFSYS